jgi:hypothetical protein
MRTGEIKKALRKNMWYSAELSNIGSKVTINVNIDRKNFEKRC